MASIRPLGKEVEKQRGGNIRRKAAVVGVGQTKFRFEDSTVKEIVEEMEISSKSSNSSNTRSAHHCDGANVANSTDGGDRIILAMVDDKEKALPLKIYSKLRNENPECSLHKSLKSYPLEHKLIMCT